VRKFLFGVSHVCDSPVLVILLSIQPGQISSHPAGDYDMSRAIPFLKAIKPHFVASFKLLEVLSLPTT
jgi:hypothetical protein